MADENYGHGRRRDGYRGDRHGRDLAAGSPRGRRLLPSRLAWPGRPGTAGIARRPAVYRGRARAPGQAGSLLIASGRRSTRPVLRGPHIGRPAGSEVLSRPGVRPRYPSGQAGQARRLATPGRPRPGRRAAAGRAAQAHREPAPASGPGRWRTARRWRSARPADFAIARPARGRPRPEDHRAGRRAEGGGSARCAVTIARPCSRRNGGVPLSSSYAAQPSEYWSARPSTLCPSICSGAM